MPGARGLGQPGLPRNFSQGQSRPSLETSVEVQPQAEQILTDTRLSVSDYDHILLNPQRLNDGENTFSIIMTCNPQETTSLPSAHVSFPHDIHPNRLNPNAPKLLVTTPDGQIWRPGGELLRPSEPPISGNHGPLDVVDEDVPVPVQLYFSYPREDPPLSATAQSIEEDEALFEFYFGYITGDEPSAFEHGLALATGESDEFPRHGTSRTYGFVSVPQKGKDVGSALVEEDEPSIESYFRYPTEDEPSPSSQGLALATEEDVESPPDDTLPGDDSTSMLRPNEDTASIGHLPGPSESTAAMSEASGSASTSRGTKRSRPQTSSVDSKTAEPAANRRSQRVSDRRTRDENRLDDEPDERGRGRGRKRPEQGASTPMAESSTNTSLHPVAGPSKAPVRRTARNRH
ncbi:hypothetical protein ONZ45_g3464 [Pleurotus djamor]|nr:hypothetical protein ONZ45_g3464 [Pleurotus djamor]